jgi:serine/threonine protein kinase
MRTFTRCAYVSLCGLALFVFVFLLKLGPSIIGGNILFLKIYIVSSFTVFLACSLILYFSALPLPLLPSYHHVMMQAIFMIPTKPPPTLKQPEIWSDNFKSFVGHCLVKNPEERASAVALLQVRLADFISVDVIDGYLIGFHYLIMYK